MSERTPRLPLHQSEGSTRYIYDSHGVSIAAADEEEYAAFIVTACNAHDEMLEAHKQIVGHKCRCYDQISDEYEDNQCPHSLARAAIAKAETPNA